MAGEMMAAGSAFGPWGAVAGGLLDVAASPGSPAAPAVAQSDNVFDSSGWTVSTGSSKAGTAAALNPWLIGGGILAAALVLIVWMKK